MGDKLFEKNISEIARDITSFGNIPILLIITALIVGFNILFIKIIIGLVIIEIIGSSIKIFYRKDRPIKENNKNLLEKIDSGSFPSLHSARSSFIFLVLLFTFSSIYLKILCILLIILISTSRIKLKKHYFIDVIAGLVLGIVGAIIFNTFII